MKLILLIIIFIILWCLLLIHINKQNFDEFEWSKERHFMNNQIDIITNCHLPLVYQSFPDNFTKIEQLYEKTVEDFTASELSDLTKLNSFRVFVAELENYQVELKVKYAYLIYKMIYGDLISSFAFREINPFLNIQETFSSPEEQFDHSIKTAEEMRQLVGGISISNQAIYLAYKFLKQFPYTGCKDSGTLSIDKHFRMGDSLDKEPIAFLETKNKLKSIANSNANAWFHIKIYKVSKKIPVRTINLFPIFKEIFSPQSNISITDCINMSYDQYESNIIYYKEKRMLSSLQFASPLSSCPDQSIGPATKLSDKEPLFIYYKINPNYTTRIRMFTHSDFESAYNCHGWGIGLEDFISPYSVNLRGLNEVTTCYEYKLFLCQLKIAYNFDKVKRQYFEFVKRDHDITDKIKIGGFLHNFINDSSSSREEMMSYLRKKIKRLPDSLSMMESEIIKYCPSTDGKEPADRTLLLYGDAKVFTHTARYSSELSSWTSKLGQLELVTHGLHDISGGSYGIPKFFVCQYDMEVEDIADNCGSFI